MTVNRYDQAIPYEYVSQYVANPIPFQELLTLGMYYGEQMNNAKKQLQDHLKTYGEFASPSDIDTERYYNEAIGKVESIVNEAAANPQLMKSAEWRSRMYNQINSVDYGLLHRFRKSAENMYLREQAVADLKAKGLYQEWFDDAKYRNLRNWDTENMGVMTNLSPDKFVTMRELGSEYTENLKPTFYKGKAPNSGQTLPFHNWMAISETDLRRQFEDHAQDLLSTDAGAKHYMRFKQMMQSQNPNYSEEQIMESFIDALTIEQSDKLIETPVLDSAALQTSLLSMKNNNTSAGGSRGGSQKQSALPYIFPTAVSQDQQREIANRARKIEEINPELFDRINADNNAWTNELIDLFTEMSKDTNIVRAMEALNVDLNDAGLMEEVQNAQNDPTLLNAYISGVMQMLPQQDVRFDGIRQKYNNLQQKLFYNSSMHNTMANSALITNTLASNIANVAGIDDKYKNNPWISVFEETSNAQLNAIDAAALATVETNLNIPEQEIIIRALFGDEKKIPAEMLKKDANSSYNWIVKNFEDQASAIASAKKQTNYTKQGSPVTTLTGGWFDRNINSSSDEAYSIRDNTAQGLYGSAKVVSVDGFSPVLGTEDQYTYRVTVKVPFEAVAKDIDNRYYTWGVEDVESSELTERTGLRTEVEDGVEYIYVPIFINRQLNSNTKGIMDAFYRNVINSSTDLDKANEQQLSIFNPGARSY